MPGPVIVDVLLVVLLVGSVFSGYRSGLLRSAAVIAGVILGAAAAYFVVPLVGIWVSAAEWRTAATLAAAILLVIAGLTLGQNVGHAIRRRAGRSRLRVVDRVLGAIATVVASALAISMLAFSLGSLGVPGLSPAIASSRVVQAINGATPEQVQRFLAQLRSAAIDDGLPRVVEAFTGAAPQIPEVQTGTAALRQAAQSVVRITGNAYACGQNQSGSGFIAATDRVVTNAHVVAGVAQPVVEVPGGQAVQGEVVYFDPVDDLAVIAAPGLGAPPLEVAGTSLTVGAQAVTDGYPFGGPFDSDPAQVIAVGPQLVADIYGASPTARVVYTLAADVEHGESGGPLLSEGGLVAGVVFAKAAETSNVGYALAMEEVQPVIAQAAALSAPVSSGECVGG